jgi:6-hydroxycyclohex-1-ene-1-carbonyl-CoA dehydrogenase
MAFDATAQGNWGCLPEHYPGALDLVLAGDVVIEPFIERFPLRDVNRVLTDVHAHRLRRRPLLIP